MVRKALLIGTIVTLLLMMVAATAFAQQGDPVKGKTTWEQKNCKSCHGDNGEGKYAGPRAGDGKTPAEYITQARTPRNQMPAYTTTQVTDAELTDIAAYMQTLPKPAAFTPQTYTAQAGDPPGKLLFAEKRCISCHAGFGAATIKARFTDQNRPVTAADVIKQLRTPARNMPMFKTTQVTDEQATQIADFLKAQAAAAQPAAAQTTPAAPAAGTAAPMATTKAAATPGTLPTTGGELPWALLVGLAGAAFGVGASLLRRAR